MPGLNLGARGGVTATVGAPQRASTISEAAFGGASTAGTPNTMNAITPNDPFGVAFWWGIAGFGLLMLIRHSLPS